MWRILIVISLVLFAFGCQKADEAKIETNAATPTNAISKAENEFEKPKVSLPIEVTKLANQSPADFEKIFGTPKEVKSTQDGGEYRTYQVLKEPKGLAVRFYGGKAKNFNLIVSKPFPSSKEALKQVFGIEIGNILPVKDVKEPLTEKYQGIFGGVKFSKVSAKKDEKGKGFIFVLAEVTR